MYPEIQLSNGVIEVNVYSPDPDNGYYRGSRFDWSGIVSQVSYQGHTFLSEYIVPHDPTKNGHTVGLSEEFGMGIDGLPAPLGYENAQPGETMLKVGAGLLERIDEQGYRFGYDYKITDTGTWRSTHGRTWAQFVHEITSDNGYGYLYTKRIELADNEPKVIIHRVLKNTGTRFIKQGHYNHNFVIIDDKPIGKGYVITLPFEIKADSDMRGLIDIKGSQLILGGSIEPDKPVFARLSGFQGTVDDNEAIIQHVNSGVGVRISGDYPVVRYNLYAAHNCICPEPFVELAVAPGQEAIWRGSYTFFCDAVDEE